MAPVLVSLLACAESRWSRKMPESLEELEKADEAQVLEEAGDDWKTL